MSRALLFLNGAPPAQLPLRAPHHQLAVCTDGAYSNYLINRSICIDYIIGDLDSVELISESSHPPLIHTPDQNKTDFEKALLFLRSHGMTRIDIYGLSGHASDHFLGNLSVALHYHTQLNLTFFDDYSCFFFAPPQLVLRDVQDRIISLLPFPTAHGVSLSGFAYPLQKATLQLGQRLSLRNRALQDEVTVKYHSGNLIIFINDKD